jgi:hypothetical protein
LSEIIYLGLDIHKDSLTIAVLPSDAIAPTRVERLPNDLAKLRRFCERLRSQGEVHACYAASGAGYVGPQLHGAMMLATELVDWRRFDHPRQLMAYLGLVPRERSSSDRSVRRCPVAR